MYISPNFELLHVTINNNQKMLRLYTEISKLDSHRLHLFDTVMFQLNAGVEVKREVFDSKSGWEVDYGLLQKFLETAIVQYQVILLQMHNLVLPQTLQSEHQFIHCVTDTERFCFLLLRVIHVQATDIYEQLMLM